MAKEKGKEKKKGGDQMHTIEEDDIGTYLGGLGRVARQHLPWIREVRRNFYRFNYKRKDENAVALSKSLNAIRTRTHTLSLSFYVGIVKEGKRNSLKIATKKGKEKV